MAAVFDAPVAAVGSKNALRIGLIRGSTCDAICDFTGIFTGFFISGLSLDEESLSYMREVEISVEFGCGPYFTDFDPAVIGGVALNKVRILAVFKKKRDVLKKSRLVVFYGEVIMSVTFLDQIIGDFALC